MSSPGILIATYNKRRVEDALRWQVPRRFDTTEMPGNIPGDLVV